jgi:hypothetical protein
MPKKMTKKGGMDKGKGGNPSGFDMMLAKAKGKKGKKNGPPKKMMKKPG